MVAPEAVGGRAQRLRRMYKTCTNQTVKSVDTSQLGTSAQKYAAALSLLPEGGILECHFNFVIIGPDAQAVVQKIAEAELHTEVTAMATTKTGTASTNTQKSGMGGKGTHRELNIQGDEKGTYTIIDERENKFARIQFDVMESYEESLPELITAHNVRNTCYICLFDMRMDVAQDVVSIVNKGIVEMGFNSQRMKKKDKNGGEKTPALRAIMLVHRGHDDHQILDPENQAHLEDLSKKLDRITKGSPLKNPRRRADFESSEELYECIDEIAQEMYGMVFHSEGCPTTRFSDLDLDDGTAKASRPCCVAQ